MISIWGQGKAYGLQNHAGGGQNETMQHRANNGIHKTTRTWSVWGQSHDHGLVESMPFERRVVGSNPASRHVGTLGKSLTRSCLWHFGVKLRHSIRAVSGAFLSSSGLEEAL